MGLPVNKIFINAVSGIGENLLFVPALRLLRKHYPAARIVMAVRSSAAAFLLKSDGLADEIIACDYGIQNNLRKKIGLLLALRKEKFDIAITAFPSNRLDKAILSWLSGAGVRVSHDQDNLMTGLFRFMSNVYVPIDYKAHDVEQNLNLLNQLGIDTSEADKEPGPWIANEADKNARMFLKKHNINGVDIFGLHPGSSGDLGMGNKRWPLDRFKALAEHLLEKYGGTVLVFLGPDETNLIFDAKPGRVFFVTQKLDVAAALIKKCRLFVGNDSSLMHIAAISDVPTIGIFGPSDPLRTGPRGPKTAVISGRSSCSPCYTFKDLGKPIKCKAGLECLNSISVEDVLALAEKIQ
jgi:heptosyltransferase-2